MKVDLDSVYEVEGKKVYQLQKTATEELNLFHLVIQISLADGRSTCLKSREFLLVGKKTAASGKFLINRDFLLVGFYYP